MALKTIITSLLATTALASTAQAHDTTQLLRDPAISENHISFVYAGDIWIADKNGENARRLTSSPATESDPTFSPDGSMIAYTGRYENNADVYAISVNGGQPERLTFHSGTDTVLDWAADGESVAFVSRRETNHGRSAQLYHAALNGGLPEKQMAARTYRGRYDNSGDLFAYIAFGSGYNGLFGGTSGWRGYRGGTVPEIQIMDISANSVATIDGEDSTNFEPMFVGEDLFFLSDREGKTINLFKFNPTTEEAERISDINIWDIRAADAFENEVIFERGGQLYVYDNITNETKKIGVNIAPDLPQLRPQWKKAGNVLQGFDISPNGKRVAITARGDVFTVPIKDGTTRNLSQTATRDYTGLWSSDGQSVAYIDASETTQYVVIKDQTGQKKTKRLKLDDNFNFLMAWAGNSDHLIYANNKLELKSIDLNSGKSVAFSEASRRDGVGVSVSPDGNWVAYTQEQPNFNRDLYLRNLASGETTLLSDGMADVSSPHFSPDGKYLYFAASTNSGPTQVGLDLSSREEPYRAAIYAAVLSNEEKSPLHKALGDEEAADEPQEEEEDAKIDAKVNVTRIDLKGLSDRIIALPIAQDNYSDIVITKDGTLFAIANVQAGARVTPPGESQADANTLIKYDFKERKLSKLQDGIIALDVSANGEHIAMQTSKRQIMTAATSGEFKPKPLSMDDVKMKIDPREEWVAIFDEAWRMEKAYYYDPNLHGLDWEAIYERYRPLVDHVGRREDLTTLMVEMIGELQSGHNRTGGGDIYREEGTNTGLLGADLVLHRGKHRIEKIYTGENWNPFIASPLSAPGINVQKGDYILAVNGHDLDRNDNIFEHLQGTSGKLVTLTIASTPNGEARDIVIEPTNSEYNARLWNWVETNRKYVDEITDGRVGYVYLPNTAGAGFTLFNRMFFSQTNKDAIILDERSNGGGHAANYITDVLSRKYLAGWKESIGLTYNTPGGAMFGPKVMLIDQDAGSGGDFLPYSFREHNLGTLIGTRTWGGLIGISANPDLIDGGYLTVPNFRFYDVNYEWTIENEGVEPDITVALDPTYTNAGKDSQLDRAIEEITGMLDKFEPTIPTEAPPYPTKVGE